MLEFISTKIGFAPKSKIELIVEQKVKGVVITSSPGFIFIAIRDKWSPAVQEFNDKQ